MEKQASNTTTPLWELTNVQFGYGHAKVLKNISLELQPGHCYGILGPNGSGKTTLLDLLSGINAPDAGHIQFQGTPMEKWPKKQLAKILGLVPQEFMVHYGFTVRETVEMGLHPHMHRFASPSVEQLELVDRMLEETGIAEMADKPVTNLSGGEKQRVALARTLAQSPEILLLDEATSNLDIYHSLEILNLIQRRFKQGALQVIAVMHDLNLAALFCDTLIFIKNGEIIHQGPVEKVLTSKIIADVYEVEAEITRSNFTNSQQVSFRLPAE